jgi:hypothetical protein
MRTLFVVRRHGPDPKSETITRADTYKGAMDQALTFMQENDRDYECFDVVEVEVQMGREVRVLGTDWGTCSWEPRG